MPQHKRTRRACYLVCALYGVAAVLSPVQLVLYCMIDDHLGHLGVDRAFEQYGIDLGIARYGPSTAGATMGVGEREDEGRVEKRTGSESGSASSGPGSPGSSSQAGSQNSGTKSPAAGERSGSPGGISDLDLNDDAQPYTRESPSDVASLDPFSTNSAVSTKSKSIHPRPQQHAGPKYMRGLVNLYGGNGMEWRDLFALKDQELPKEEKSDVPKDAEPDRYGFVQSHTNSPTPQYITQAMRWLAMSDPSLRHLQVQAGMGMLISVWKDKGANAAGAAQNAPPTTPEYPFTNAEYEIMPFPRFRLLVALKVQEPSRQGWASSPFTRSREVPPKELYPVDQASPPKDPGIKKTSTGLSDKEIDQVPMRHPSDFWHLDWTRDCDDNLRVAAGLTYILLADADKASRDAMQYAVSEQFVEGEDAIEPWPGHIYQADSRLGTALLGTPAVSNVARLLVQHKQVHGQHRAVQAIRFWRAEAVDEHGKWDVVYPMLVTLTGMHGYHPVVVHDEDQSDVESGSSGSLLE